MTAVAGPTRREVVQLGPTLEEPGGIASVIRIYTEAELGPFRARAIATYGSGSAARRLGYLLRAVVAILRLPAATTAGVHVHVSQNFDLVRSLCLVRLARLRGVRSVATIHGSSFVRSASRHPRIASLLVRSVVCVTALNEETVAKARLLGASEVIALPNPIHVTAARRKTGTEKRVLFAGEVGRRKGVDVLLAAWPTVVAAHGDAGLRLLGPVVDETLLEGLPDGVEVTGAMSPEDVRRELDRATVAVLPSRAEALPMFVLEAMAAGVPVVSTPVGGIEGAVGDAGLIVPVDDALALAGALAQLLGDPAHALVLGSRGAARIRATFSATEVLPRMAHLYERAFA